MRTYGRILKNIAAVATLLALLSLLLPFCRIPADGQNLVLSGMDVIKAGTRAGYTYFTTGSIPDTFVLKTPVTVGILKSALSYVQGAGMTRILLVCAVAVLLLVLLAFFHVYAVIGRRKENNGISNVVYRGNCVADCGCFCRISGTETVFTEGRVFVCNIGCHCYGLHYDWMDHRRILQTKNRRRPGKTSA